MVTLTPRERQPAGERIADDLRLKILLGEDDLLPGVLLPAESEMAEAYGVSRPTMRRALAILRAEGLVATTAGQGSKVVRRTEADPDVTELVEAPVEVALLLKLIPGAPVTRRREIHYRGGRPVRLVLTYTGEQVG